MRESIREIKGLKLKEGDSFGMRNAIRDARRTLGATLPPLRDDLLCTFCERDDDDFADFLTGISPTNRIRNGLTYYDFAFTVLPAAGVTRWCKVVAELSRSLSRSKGG